MSSLRDGLGGEQLQASGLQAGGVSIDPYFTGSLTSANNIKAGSLFAVTDLSGASLHVTNAIASTALSGTNALVGTGSYTAIRTANIIGTTAVSGILVSTTNVVASTALSGIDVLVTNAVASTALSGVSVLATSGAFAGNVTANSKTLSTAGTGSPTTWGRFIQGGAFAADAGSDAVVVFGTAFTSAPNVLVGGLETGSGNFQVTAINATGCDIVSEHASASGTWLAFGPV